MLHALDGYQNIGFYSLPRRGLRCLLHGLPQYQMPPKGPSCAAGFASKMVSYTNIRYPREDVTGCISLAGHNMASTKSMLWLGSLDLLDPPYWKECNSSFCALDMD
jgi:hypothetical protein